MSFKKVEFLINWSIMMIKYWFLMHLNFFRLFQDKFIIFYFLLLRTRRWKAYLIEKSLFYLIFIYLTWKEDPLLTTNTKKEDHSMTSRVMSFSAFMQQHTKNNGKEKNDFNESINWETFENLMPVFLKQWSEIAEKSRSEKKEAKVKISEKLK